MLCHAKHPHGQPKHRNLVDLSSTDDWLPNHDLLSHLEWMNKDYWFGFFSMGALIQNLLANGLVHAAFKSYISTVVDVVVVVVVKLLIMLKVLSQ